MDLSFWTKLNPKIVYEPTRKQFYNRFCYKLVIEAYGGRVIYEQDSADQALSKRRQQSLINYNYGGSWARREQEELKLADPVMLDILRSIKNGYGSSIKLRVEEPWVQIYATDEQTLRDIVTRFDTQSLSRLLSVTMPESINQLSLLEDGNIISKASTKIPYDYKVMLRDGNYGKDVTKRVAGYLRDLGNDVQVSKSTMQMLEGGMSYIWGCYFYTNDPAIVTMLALISPQIVRKIHKIVKI